MKVVINTCYGGFGISVEALFWLIKKNSTAVKKIPWNKWSNDSVENAEKDFKTEFKEGFKSSYYNVLYKDGFVYDLINRYEDEKIRSHSDLIEVVEMLKDRANGGCAKLKVVEIPDGIDYSIDVYDGLESIHESHRCWR